MWDQYAPRLNVWLQILVSVTFLLGKRLILKKRYNVPLPRLIGTLCFLNYNKNKESWEEVIAMRDDEEKI